MPPAYPNCVAVTTSAAVSAETFSPSATSGLTACGK